MWVHRIRCMGHGARRVGVQRVRYTGRVFRILGMLGKAHGMRDAMEG